MKKIIFAITIFAILLLFGCTNNQNDDQYNDHNFVTFKEIDNSVCAIDGKPIIRLYSTTGCPHCKWINDTYNNTVNEYANQGKIIAHHYEFDTNKDTLNPEISGISPQEEALFLEFNPRGTIPTFIFGCKYYRIGNGYEPTGKTTIEKNKERLELEEAEFRKIIEKLINETKQTN
ncbi:MAG: hypothetical protein GX950_01825 [Candidatus Diapherotrites archaeon]|uniref:Thioredoxin domain-containing protein n=1 Tax=Candidatus Iainarchaeum sp. TaxID=3101447 RepID=A0A7K4BZB2_9ARCH|nr:hypothetical protein [Candidatus Diapherotrites archaeon]